MNDVKVQVQVVTLTIVLCLQQMSSFFKTDAGYQGTSQLWEDLFFLSFLMVPW